MRDRGEHAQRRGGRFELAAAVVRDDDRVRSRLAREARVLRAHDALHDEAPLPLAPDLLEVRPVQVVALGEIALDIAREDGCAALGERILEVRHAVAKERA